MKTPTVTRLLTALLLASLAALNAADAPQAAAKIELLTPVSVFNTTQPAQSTLTAQNTEAEFTTPTDALLGFTVKLAVNLKPTGREKEILSLPGVLRVCLRPHDPRDRKLQNYPAFPMPDGSVPVLEAAVMLHSPQYPAGKEMTIGIPLAMLKQPEGKHEVVLNFSGVRWTIYVDGEFLDNDFPLGYPRWADKPVWKMDAEHVTQAAIFSPAIAPEEKPAPTPRLAAVQYWMPQGHNAWVGDVATFFHQGRYHVFYLYDRRHHASKFGKGAHYFEHLSTADFKTWTEHEAATPLEEQWELIGTGTPFVNDGKFCVAYGLHTERIFPDEKTTLPAQLDWFEKHGRTGSFDRTAPGAPIGSTYSVSEDGISKFKKTWTFFHPCRNPSVYRDPSGKLRMLANYGGVKTNEKPVWGSGIWESDSLDGGWHCVNPDFPLGGDCTFFFRWGKFDYIIGGFKNLWSKPAEAPNSAYEDVVAKGLDFYDGLNVPAITEVAPGRFLMAGWTTIRGWGGQLVIRDLLQLPDGRIGSKWMKEIMPETGAAKTLAQTVAGEKTYPSESRSFLLEFTVQPSEAKKGKIGLSFLPENGEQGSCELQIRLEDLCAQFAPASLSRFADRQKSLREGANPAGGGNYAIENLLGVDQTFGVRVIVKNDGKIGGSLIDVEIAGQRTLLTYRADLDVKKLLVRAENSELRNLQIAPLQ